MPHGYKGNMYRKLQYSESWGMNKRTPENWEPQGGPSAQLGVGIGSRVL